MSKKKFLITGLINSSTYLVLLFFIFPLVQEKMIDKLHDNDVKGTIVTLVSFLIFFIFNIILHIVWKSGEKLWAFIWQELYFIAMIILWKKTKIFGWINYFLSYIFIGQISKVKFEYGLFEIILFVFWLMAVGSFYVALSVLLVGGILPALGVLEIFSDSSTVEYTNNKKNIDTLEALREIEKESHQRHIEDTLDDIDFQLRK